jgi:hypothetical protein
MAARQRIKSRRGAPARREVPGRHRRASPADADVAALMVDGLGSSRRQSVEDLRKKGDVGAVLRLLSVLNLATIAGYLHGRKSERIGGRVAPGLLSAAMDKSGLRSQAELLEYALAKVALEDDYGSKLLSMKGSVADDVEL